MKAEEQLGQLGAEAAAVAEALKATDTREGAPPPGAGSDAGAKQAAPESPSDGAAGGAPEAERAEVIKNPAPVIRAALSMVRDVPMVRAFMPQAFIAALSDEAIGELAEAFGDLAVKYKINLGGLGLDEWKEEMRAALAVGSVAFNIWRAMHADDEQSRAARARDVTEPAAPGWRDPPNPAAGARPVEPGA